MHKGIILLFKAETKDDIDVDKFMEPYGDGKVWDWYQIGGRWSGSINPLFTVFNEKTKEKKKELTAVNKNIGITDKQINENKEYFQKIWEEIGGTGKNPLSRDQYKQSEEGNEDDIIPLKDCIDIVNEWGNDKAKHEFIVEETKKMNEYKAKKDQDMYGYMMIKIGNFIQENFCFDCNVFNTETYDYSIPKDIENWYAVMIDIHN